MEQNISKTWEIRNNFMEKVWEIIGNIRRFDNKEIGADYYAGWDNALDIVIMDLNELASRYALTEKEIK